MSRNSEQEDLQYLQDFHGIHPHEVQEIRSALHNWGTSHPWEPMLYTMPEYVHGRNLGIPHHQLLEVANYHKSGSDLGNYIRARSLGIDHDRATKMVDDVTIHPYLNAREAGATHEEFRQARLKDVDLYRYALYRGRGHNHEQSMALVEESSKDDKAERRRGWLLNDGPEARRDFNSEYNQYHYKKSLGLGATHEQIVEAHQAGIDLEDYNLLLRPQHRSNPNFSLSHDEIMNLHKSGMLNNLPSDTYVQGRAVGIPHHELEEAHQTIENLRKNPGSRHTDVDRLVDFGYHDPLTQYVRGREQGLDHKKSLNLLERGINPIAYIKARYHASDADIQDAVKHGLNVGGYSLLREHANHKQALEVNSSGMNPVNYGYPRLSGATHDEVMDAYRAGIHPTDYAQHREQGLSHQEVMSKLLEGEKDTTSPNRPNPSTASRRDKFNSRTASESNGPRYISYPTYKRLKDEHRHLTTQGRIEVAKLIETARGLGDLSENGDYQAAKQQQGEMESRINQLEHLLTTSVPMKRMHVPGRVNVGDKVHLQYEGSSAPEQFILVDPEDATTLGSNAGNFISPNSPAGVALLGKQSGETVEWHGGSGLPVSATIKHVEPVDHGSEFEDFDSHEGPVTTKRVAPSLDVKDIPEQAPDYKPYNWQEHFAQE